MRRTKNEGSLNSTPKLRKMRPASTPEAREEQMICLADQLAEQKLRDGTASSQLIVHYLKLGSSSERLDRDIRLKEKELIDEKIKSMRALQNSDKLFNDAINAMRQYSGQSADEQEFSDA